MKPVLAATVALMTAIVVTPVHAAPPTATPSPGYDARLQEQRKAAATVYVPLQTAPGRKKAKPPQ